MSSEPPALPRALDDDDDDVAWALQTAGVQWERGGAADAVVWLKRAAEAAAEAGEFGRSADIQRRANEIDRWLKSRVSFLDDDGDDGVDELLNAEAPEIEAGGLAEPTASLVDALEAEARDHTPGGGFGDEGAPVQDLGDLEDVEDIEAVDLDEFEEQRSLRGYGDEPLDEITHARSELTSVPDHVPGPSARPGSRPSKPSKVPASRPSKAPASQPSSSRSPSSVRKAPASSRSLAPAKRAPKPLPSSAPKGGRPLPPPPIPRLPLPLPLPKPSTPPVDLGTPRQPFPSEPPTRPTSERPPPPDDLLPDEPLPRDRTESMVEVADDDIELPTVEPPARPSIAARFAEQPQPVSTAAPAEVEAAVDALLETPPPPALLDVALLAACRGLEDLPPETQAELASRARVDVLAPDQEVSGFGLALVTQGNVVVMPTIAEGACGYAGRGEPVFSRGTLSEGVPLRVVALQDGAEVASWRPDDFEQVLVTCPWVADELKAVADRFQALAGAAMGPLGERLDDNMRQMLTDRCELLVLQEGDVLLEEGKTPAGLYILGGGSLEMVSGGAVQRELGPGDLPFASSVLTHEPASALVRVGAGGALVLHADRMASHELIVSVPPLLELLSMV
jgi:CRP-like cAMP-binding protein